MKRDKKECYQEGIDFIHNAQFQMLEYNKKNHLPKIRKESRTIAEEEDIIINKKMTYNVLMKVFDAFAQTGRFIFVIDNFDFIDGFSIEFLTHFMQKNEDSPEIDSQHTQLVNAIINKNASLAEKIMNEHMHTIERLLNEITAVHTK